MKKNSTKSLDVDDFEEVEDDSSDSDEDENSRTEIEQDNVNSGEQNGEETNSGDAQEDATPAPANTPSTWTKDVAVLAEQPNKDKRHDSPVTNTKSNGDSAGYSGLNWRDRNYVRLVDLYVFAAKYEALQFRQAIILTLQRCIYKWDRLPC